MYRQCSEVHCKQQGYVGVISLNRPKALNALNAPMIDSIYETMLHWRERYLFERRIPNGIRGPRVVVIQAEGRQQVEQGSGAAASAARPAFFCAGGDVKSIVSRGREGDTEYGLRFFVKEYYVDYLISQYCMPWVSFMDGITMGGGVGLCIHGTFQIATERSVFAMPECAIGLFPDIGASYFLPRLEGGLGMYLGLTGARLEGVDLKYAGVATHYIQSHLLDRLLEDLSNMEISGISYEAEQQVGALLRQYEDMHPLPKGQLCAQRQIIDDIFHDKASVDEILKACDPSVSTFHARMSSMLASGSPISLRLTFRQIMKGASLPLVECFRMDHRLINRLALNSGSDFYRGVKAMLIDKTKKPKWNIQHIEDVPESMIDQFFSPLAATQELQLPLLYGSENSKL